MTPFRGRVRPVLLAVAVQAACIACRAQPGPVGFFQLADDALASAPSIAAKRREAEGAGHALDAARWGRFPSLSVSTAGRPKYDRSATGITRPGSTARLDQSLYTWGAIEGRITSAQLQQDAARLAVDTEANAVIDRLIGAFVQMQQAQERLAIQQNALVRLRDYEGMIARRLATQVSSRNDVSLVNSRIEQTLSDIATAEAQLQKARAALQELTGRTVAAVAPAAPRNTPVDATADPLERAALAAAPEIASARDQVQAAEADAQVRAAEIKPRVFARLEYNYTPGVLGGSDRYAQAYIGLEASLSNGLSQFELVKQAVSRKEAAEQQMEVATRSVRQQAQSVWSDLAASSRQLAASAEVVRNNEDVVASFLRQYVAGKKAWLDVLNSERELTQSRIGMADLRGQAAAADLRARRLSGLLVDTASTPSPEPGVRP